MKKAFMLLVMVVLCVIAVSAQSNVTTFLGIPVDGTEEEMVRKLKAKGFKDSEMLDGSLEGEFNGEDVNISIVSDNGRVWRICVWDKTERSENQIKLRFEKLFRQFLNNEKYVAVSFLGEAVDASDPQKIYEFPEDENIGYEMSVHDKQYAVTFVQRPENMFALVDEERQKVIQHLISTGNYTPEQFENPTDGLGKLAVEFAAKRVTEKMFKNDVWFTIIDSPLSRGYRICIYYENENNQADGSDL